MRNFLLADRRIISFYLVLFGLFTILHFLVMYIQGGFETVIILVDALVSQVLLFMILLSLWYVIRFSGAHSATSLRQFSGSFFALLFLVLIWVFASRKLLESLFAVNEAYKAFLGDTMIIKAVFGLGMGIIVHFFFYNYHLIRVTREVVKREHQLKNLVQQTELQALKNQLNPHFIYNSLNTISSLTTIAPEKAREMIIRLSDFLRYALKQDAMQLTTLKNEIASIKLYLEIEAVRFGEKLYPEFNIQNEDLAQELPVMILQPLFENAIKHGVQESEQPVNIFFKTFRKDKNLVLSLTNTFDPRYTRFKGEGIGLENIRNRLRLIYGNGNLLQIRAEDKVFIANLTIPLKAEKKD